jgi:hypothetical protein
MQVFRTGKIGRAGSGDKVLTFRGQVGKKTGRQAGLERRKDQKGRQTQDRHDGHTFWMRTQIRNEGKQTEKRTFRLDNTTGPEGNKQKIRERQKTNDTESTGRLSLLSRQEEWWQARLTG